MIYVGTRTPTARKLHQCTGCFAPIEPGEKYFVHKHVDIDGWNTTKLHAECHQICSKESDGDGFEPGSFPPPARLTSPPEEPAEDECKCPECGALKRMDDDTCAGCYDPGPAPEKV